MLQYTALHGYQFTDPQSVQSQINFLKDIIINRVNTLHQMYNFRKDQNSSHYYVILFPQSLSEYQNVMVHHFYLIMYISSQSKSRTFLLQR